MKVLTMPIYFVHLLPRVPSSRMLTISFTSISCILCVPAVSYLRDVTTQNTAVAVVDLKSSSKVVKSSITCKYSERMAIYYTTVATTLHEVALIFKKISALIILFAAWRGILRVI